MDPTGKSFPQIYNDSERTKTSEPIQIPQLNLNKDNLNKNNLDKKKLAIGLRSCSTAATLPVSIVEKSAVEDKVHDLKPIAKKLDKKRLPRADLSTNLDFKVTFGEGIDGQFETVVSRSPEASDKNCSESPDKRSPTSLNKKSSENESGVRKFWKRINSDINLKMPEGWTRSAGNLVSVEEPVTITLVNNPVPLIVTTSSTSITCPSSVVEQNSLSPRGFSNLDEVPRANSLPVQIRVPRSKDGMGSPKDSANYRSFNLLENASIYLMPSSLKQCHERNVTCLVSKSTVISSKKAELKSDELDRDLFNQLEEKLQEFQAKFKQFVTSKKMRKGVVNFINELIKNEFKQADFTYNDYLVNNPQRLVMLSHAIGGVLLNDAFPNLLTLYTTLRQEMLLGGTEMMWQCYRYLSVLLVSDDWGVGKESYKGKKLHEALTVLEEIFNLDDIQSPRDVYINSSKNLSPRCLTSTYSMSDPNSNNTKESKVHRKSEEKRRLSDSGKGSHGPIFHLNHRIKSNKSHSQVVPHVTLMHPIKKLILMAFFGAQDNRIAKGEKVIEELKYWNQSGLDGLLKEDSRLNTRCTRLAQVYQLIPSYFSSLRPNACIAHYCFSEKFIDEPEQHSRSYAKNAAIDTLRCLVHLENVLIGTIKINGVHKINVDVTAREFLFNLIDAIYKNGFGDISSEKICAERSTLYMYGTPPSDSQEEQNKNDKCFNIYEKIPSLKILELLNVNCLQLCGEVLYRLYPKLGHHPKDLPDSELRDVDSPYIITYPKNLVEHHVTIVNRNQFQVKCVNQFDVCLKLNLNEKIARFTYEWTTEPSFYGKKDDKEVPGWLNVLTLNKHSFFEGKEEEHFEPVMHILTHPMSLSGKEVLPGLHVITKIASVDEIELKKPYRPIHPSHTKTNANKHGNAEILRKS